MRWPDNLDIGIGLDGDQCIKRDTPTGPTLKGNPFCQPTSNFTFCYHLTIQIMMKTANIWEYKVGIDDIIVNFVNL